MFKASQKYLFNKILRYLVIINIRKILNSLYLQSNSQVRTKNLPKTDT